MIKIITVFISSSYYFNCTRFHLTFFYVELLSKSMLIQLNLTSSREFLDKTLNIIVESDLNKTSLSVLHKSKILSVLLIFSYFFNCRRFHLTFFYVEILSKSMSIQLNLTSSRYKRFDQDMKDSIYQVWSVWGILYGNSVGSSGPLLKISCRSIKI